MRRKILGYEPMCESLLKQGVPAKSIIKHRFLIEALALRVTKPPIADYDGGTTVIRLENNDRRLVFELADLSTRAVVAYEVIDPEHFHSIEWQTISAQRAALTDVENMTLFLHPLSEDLTLWEKLRLWFAGVIGK